MAGIAEALVLAVRSFDTCNQWIVSRVRWGPVVASSQPGVQEMNHCPNCLSDSTVGTDVAAMCVECGTAAAGTFAVNVPALLVAAAAITLGVMAFGALRNRFASRALASA